MKDGGESVALSDPLQVVEHNSIRMHHLAASLLSKNSLQVKISYQSVSYCTRKRPCFHLFLQFQIVSNNTIMHALDTLFSIIFVQFQIFPNTIRIHALETLYTCTQSTPLRTHCQRRGHFKMLQSAIKT